MKYNPLIILVLLLHFFVLCQEVVEQENECTCDNYYVNVLSYSSVSNEIIICGTIDTKDSLIYEMTVYDCLKDTLLIDNKHDEISPNKIVLNNDGFLITSYHLTPIGENWEMFMMPFTEISYKFDNSGNLIIHERLVFNYPELSLDQIKDIKELCDKLEHALNEENKVYIFDYETLYMLFIGAYKDIYSAKELLLNLPDLFELDGAIMETFNELRIESIFKKVK